MSLMIQDVGDYLKQNGIKPSYQRIKIYEFLMGTKAHPTVDVIYKALVKDIPTLSKTTVYNTLNLFIENRIAQLITIEENETRYDADTSLHGHFKCTACGHVLDFHVDRELLNPVELEGYKVEEQHLYFKGLCAECAEMKN